MAVKEIKFIISEKDFKNNISKINNEINLSLDKEYREKFKETLKQVFSDLNNSMEKGLSPDRFNNLIQNSLSSLSNLIVPGISDTLSNIIGLSMNIIRDLFKNKDDILFEQQKLAIGKINIELDKRNSLLEIAKKLNSAILDTTIEELEYQKESAELLLQSLNLETDIENINTENILSKYEELNNKIAELKKMKNDIESDLVDDNIFDNIGNWWDSLWGNSKEDKIAQIEAELDALVMEAEQYEELVNLLDAINELKKQQIEETYKEQEIIAEIKGDNEAVFQAQLGYYREMLEKSKELGLSKLEELELEKNIQDLISDRFDSMIEEYDKEQELIIKRAKFMGKSENEINELRIQAIDNLIKAKETEIANLGSTTDKEMELIDLELERLSIQKEINGELATEGILYDKNVRKQLRSIIEARKIGDAFKEQKALMSSVQILLNRGLSISEVNEILGANIQYGAFENLLTSNKKSDLELPNIDGVIPAAETLFDTDTQIVYPELSEIMDVSNDILNKELEEIITQNQILTEQNTLLSSIDNGIKEGKNINIELNHESSKHKNFSPSRWIRFVNEMERQNRK